jgi:hypothetical protein
MNDFSFANALVNAVAEGGKILIRETNETFERDKGIVRKLVYALNRLASIKVGHPHPPRGRIAAAFERHSCDVAVEYADPTTDIVLATRRH